MFTRLDVTFLFLPLLTSVFQPIDSILFSEVCGPLPLMPWISCLETVCHQREELGLHSVCLDSVKLINWLQTKVFLQLCLGVEFIQFL